MTLKDMSLWCRAEWEVLKTVIGQVEEPFQVTLLYTSCLGEDGAKVALDSLEFIDCESGEFIIFYSALLISSVNTSCSLFDQTEGTSLFKLEICWLLVHSSTCLGTSFFYSFHSSRKKRHWISFSLQMSSWLRLRFGCCDPCIVWMPVYI